MASFFNLVLDTLGPQGCSVVINDGAAKTGAAQVALNIATTDADTTGYTMKVYGDIGDGAALGVNDVDWETYTVTKTVQLRPGDGMKTVYVVIRDDVWNEAVAVSDMIVMDTSVPVVTITGPSASKLSTVSGKDSTTFSFTCTEDFEAYKVMVVPSVNSAVGDGTLISSTNGSSDMDVTGVFTANTPISLTIKGADFKTAKGGGDGVGIVKVFVFDGVAWSA